MIDVSIVKQPNFQHIDESVSGVDRRSLKISPILNDHPWEQSYEWIVCSNNRCCGSNIVVGVARTVVRRWNKKEH